MDTMFHMGVGQVLRILLVCSVLTHLAGDIPTAIGNTHRATGGTWLEPLAFPRGVPQAAETGARVGGAPEQVVAAVEPDRTDTQPATIAPARVPAVVVDEGARCSQWWTAAVAAGWAADDLLDLDVVMYRESRCLADVWNRKDPNGGSRGLLQVNGFWTKWLRERGIITVVEDLYLPANNLAASLAIYQYGMDRYGYGWGPWGFRDGRPSRT